jgi:hypothetical protein
VGQRDAAVPLVELAMRSFADLGDGWSIAEGLEAVATTRSDVDPRGAALLGGAAERLRERIGMRPHPSDVRLRQVRFDEARGRLPNLVFDEAWNEGRRMALESALDIASPARAG